MFDAKMKIFTGTANPELAQKIAKYMNCEMGELNIKKFPDGEIWVKINENVRGTDCFIIQ